MTVPITTTLNAVCPYLKANWEGRNYFGITKAEYERRLEQNWEILRKHLGKTEGDEQLKFSTIMEAVGLEPAYHCLHALSEEHQSFVLNFEADVAERVLPIFEKQYPDDKRPREAIQAKRDYADGKITKEKLKEKRKAAVCAANAANAVGDDFAAIDKTHAAWDKGVAIRTDAWDAALAATDVAMAAAYAATATVVGATNVAQFAIRANWNADRVQKADYDSWIAILRSEEKTHGELLRKRFS